MCVFMYIELFRVLKEKWGANLSSFILDKVFPISGDISYDNLKILDSGLREEIWKEFDIVVNSATTIRFVER